MVSAREILVVVVVVVLGGTKCRVEFVVLHLEVLVLVVDGAFLILLYGSTYQAEISRLQVVVEVELAYQK